MLSDALAPGILSPERRPLAFEHDKLVIARWIAAGSLGAIVLSAAALRYVQTGGYLLGVVAFIAGYNVLLSKTRWARSNLRRAILVSITLDLLAVTAFLGLSGDIENPLCFAYALPVIAGAALLSGRTGLLLAAGAVLLFILLLSMIILDFPIPLAHHHLDLHTRLRVEEVLGGDIRNAESWGFLLTHVVTLAAVLFGVAAGFGGLTDRLREDRGALEAEYQRTQLVLDTVPDGLVLLDKDGTVVIANGAAGTLVPGIAQGRSVGELQPLVAEEIGGLSAGVKEIEVKAEDRYHIHVLARRSADGPIVWVVRDLTERQRMMAELIHRSKMADLGLLAAGIAHELGNPLSSMSALIELLEIKGTAPEAAPLKAHIERMNRIIQEITRFGRPSSGQRSRCDATSIVDKALSMFRMNRRSEGKEVTVVRPSVPADVEAVEDQLVQVLLNLLLNGADAINGQGRLTVAILPEADRVRIAVTDTGHGMSSRVMRRLFTPFFTTKDPGFGTGLGLFVSDAIVQEHGGRIEVRSATDKGSTFTVLLPRAA